MQFKKIWQLLALLLSLSAHSKDIEYNPSTYLLESQFQNLTYIHPLLATHYYTFEEINNFSTDGCSIPLKKYFKGKLKEKLYQITHCCIIHDVSYWMGGSFDHRKKADREIRICVDKVLPSKHLLDGHEHKITIGSVMEKSIRVGGGPYVIGKIPSQKDYRWAYGYSIGAGYQKEKFPNVQKEDIYDRLLDLKSELEKSDADQFFEIPIANVKKVLNYVEQSIRNLKESLNSD